MVKCESCRHDKKHTNCAFCPPEYDFYEPKHNIPAMPKDKQYKNLFPLIIDSREVHGNNVEFITMFEELGFEVKIQTLEIGDYQYGEIGVERKTAIGDFTKLEDVFMKVDELKMAYPHPILVVEGTLEEAIDQAKFLHPDKADDAEKKLLGAVASLWERGVPPIFCGKREHMVRIMAGMFRKHYDGKDRGIEVHALRPKATLGDIKLNAIAKIPGVGRHRATKLLEEFKTIENIIKSTPEKLMNIDGIGSITAKKILDALK
jgi:ERCC4-type nuclease